MQHNHRKQRKGNSRIYTSCLLFSISINLFTKWQNSILRKIEENSFVHSLQIAKKNYFTKPYYTSTERSDSFNCSSSEPVTRHRRTNLSLKNKNKHFKEFRKPFDICSTWRIKKENFADQNSNYSLEYPI